MRVIKVKESIFSDNQKAADELRSELTAKGIFMLNVMSAPGSGKTTLLTSLINILKSRLKIAVMDVDIDSELDARRLTEATGVPGVQIHNGGLCHIDAAMTAECINEAAFFDIDLLVLENIGNLVCPAEFDTGAHMNMMLLSVPEGDDKALKYPLMFSVCNTIVITKLDTLPVFDFNMDRCISNIKRINPQAEIIPVSAKTGDGVKRLADRISLQVTVMRNKKAAE